MKHLTLGVEKQHIRKHPFKTMKTHRHKPRGGCLWAVGGRETTGRRFIPRSLSFDTFLSPWACVTLNENRKDYLLASPHTKFSRIANFYFTTYITIFSCCFKIINVNNLVSPSCLQRTTFLHQKKGENDIISAWRQSLQAEEARLMENLWVWFFSFSLPPEGGSHSQWKKGWEWKTKKEAGGLTLPAFKT